MVRSSNTKKWVTCGAVVLVLGCIGAVVAFGGLAAIGAWFGDITPTQQIAVNVTATLPSIATDTAPPVQVETPPTSTPIIKAIPFESVVQIIAYYYDNGQLVPGWTGSGSVISPDGLILTNAHVVLSDRYYTVGALAVAFTTTEDHAPEIRYYAEVVQADEALDIAVIRLTTDMNQNPLDHANLNLPYIPLGNADNLRLGDQITILGYPGIGGETITLTRGEVSGFTSEQGRGNRAFIKTSATIAGGNSGGLAADQNGYLIGIPTQLGYGGDDQFVDCRVLADTNRDGAVDENDNCVPTGGFINALRPVNLALPLIEAARQGIVAVNENAPVPTPQTDLPDQGTVLFQDDFSQPNPEWDWQGDAGDVYHLSGALNISIEQSEYFLWGVPGQSFGDVVIDVDAFVATPAGDADYGVICRYQDNENFYGFEISEDGYYAIWKYINGEYLALVDWRASSLVAETNQRAHFTVACVGDTLALAVNGELLAEVRDGDLTYGDAGVVAGTWETPRFVVTFDNFVVSKPGN